LERRLTAILAADVTGYSRLMGADEEGTLAQLNEHRRALVDPKIAEHRGRIVKTTGDGLLAEFASVVEAVRCAVEIQHGMAERNALTPPDKHIQFRIGINVGDIIIEGDDIFGDGVNVAARLEGIAEPGGICVSARVREDVDGKLDIPFDDIGEQKLKNIARPVRAFRVRLDGAATAAGPKRRWTMRAIAATIAVALALAVVALFAMREPLEVFLGAAPVKPTAVTAMPTIAVLPFANQTGDHSQEYFVDGVTEEVINALGRFKTLRVIGRNAILRFKTRPPTQEEIASELGVNYLVSGSIRRSDKRVRIAAELSEARAGTVMWADRFEGELTDIFEFQDTIARRIAGTLAANITQVEGRRRLEHPRPNPTAFDLVLRARAIGHAASRTANRQFRELITKAVELDPNYAAAHALLAEALSSQAILGWTEFPDRELSRGAAEAQKAIALAPNEPEGYRALGRIHVNRAEYEEAQNALKRAIEINPSDADALATWGTVQTFSGEIAGAIDSLQLALKLDPMLEPNHMFDLVAAYYLARRHEDALHTAERGIARYPNFVMFHATAAAAAAQLGRKEQATGHADALRRRVPFLDLEALGSRFRDPSHAAYLREGLRLAGF
jgi:class 3 adenylate cyclase/TolB-like protein/cytochrome c-type biogenesis protein CcmH/NrfG